MSKNLREKEASRNKRNELEKRLRPNPIALPVSPVMAKPVFGISQGQFIQAPSRSVIEGLFF